MGTTKIFVIHLKQLIRTIVFVILGTILIGLLIYFFIPKETEETAIYNPGKYSSAIILNDNPINVEVSVSENKILDIELLNMALEQEVFYPLMQPTMQSLAQEIIAKQSIDVEIVPETEFTSNLILQAVDVALSKARVPIEREQ